MFKRQRPWLPSPAPDAVATGDQLMDKPELEKASSDTHAVLGVEDEEPLEWATHPLCIQDPFIRDKVNNEFHLTPTIIH